MSGHSKWATTKRAKSAIDAKRGNIFTKLSKNITIAARSGVDPETNFKLRIAIDKARGFNMPKDNIERAVKRATGIGGDSNIENLLYEAYGPEGVAILIEAITDNKNRAVATLKQSLGKHDGSLAGSGSVLWMFDMRGEIILNKKNLNEQEELQVIEMGIIDVVNEEPVKLITEINDLEKIKNNLQAKGFEISSSEMVYLSKNKVEVKDSEKLIKLLDELDELDDVNNIYTNANI
ncbi:MAG: YebC/PmpR family DNA-binding transcriptional regulator [Patescibacteria group bacterium]|jgi:YebC/PmpR family DNA-binding regulatory protein